MIPGIFQGLWSGVSTNVGQAIGAGVHLQDEKTGAADKIRAYDLDTKKIDLEAEKTKQKNIQIIAIVFIVAIFLGFAMWNKNR